MSDIAFDALIGDILAAGDGSSVVAALDSFARVSGLSGFAIGEMSAASTPAMFYLADFPPDWTDFGPRWSRALDDARVRMAMSGLQPFTSGALRPLPEGVRRALATSSGPPRGALIVPVRETATGIGFVSYVASETAFSAGVRAAAERLAIHAFERARALTRVSPSAAGVAPALVLTAREHQCLEFVASGLSDAQIALKLDISWSTAHYHVEHARRKLGAHNRAHAIACAIRSRLI
jgi:DNA-binding CsgD family transcriptional regulator